MRLIDAIVNLARRHRRTRTMGLPVLDLPPPVHAGPQLEPPKAEPASAFVGLPTHGQISSRFGSRFHPILHRQRLHAGVDIAAPVGTPVWSTSAGVVRFAGVQRGYGNTVVIDHPGGRQTLYGHLSAIHVRRGQEIKAGQHIGNVGKTGRVTGAHLHYEVRRNGKPVDPGVG